MKASILPLTALALAIAGCSGKPDDKAADAAETDTAVAASATPEAAGSAVAADGNAAQFLTDAMKGDNSEVRVAKLAADKGSTKGVRDFGTMLATDHGAHLDKVKAAAHSLGVPMTAETKPDADALYAKLQGMRGADFDKTFLAAMIANHKKGIASNEKEAASGDPSAVTELAKATVPTLKHHLETAQSLQ